MKKIIISISAFLFSGFAYAQLSQAENYVQSKTYLEPITTSSSTAKQIQTVQYFDGLGRPKQIVNVKASPSGKDLVTNIPYDGFGRQADAWLPAPMDTQNGGIQSGVETSAKNYHGDNFPFTHKNLENSPLDRVLSQVQPGSDWQGHPLSFQYEANTVNDQVYKFETATSWQNGVTITGLKVSEESYYGYYTANTLYKNTVTDEDGNKTIEFKNGQGNVLLERKLMPSGYSADTYYIYNEYKQLAFVISPKAMQLLMDDGLAGSESVPDPVLNDLCYQYRYDGRSRLVEKKLPGKGWEYLCYDQADRLILTQDAELRKKERWEITKYDLLGRVAYTGIIAGGSRADMQSQTGSTIIKETRNDGNYFIRNGMQVYYTNSLFYQIETVLSVNYYDTYPPGSPITTSQVMGQALLPQAGSGTNVSTKSLPLASYLKNIEDDNWTKSYTGYDMKGRPVITYSINHLGGYTHTESLLDFSGLAQQIVTRHKRLSTDTERLITETFEYDNQNRLLVHKHKVDNNAEEILVQNTYNELSQLQIKKVGGKSLSNPLQTIDYKYNIRGWMTQINDPNNLGSDLFGYKINYNLVEGQETPNADFPDLKVKPRYNGNIAEVSWKTLTEQSEPLKRYGYVYDPINRLTAGFYQNETNPTAKEYFEKLDYDLNGNITRLRRSNGIAIGTPTPIQIDNLKYQYSGNKLIKVTEEQVGNNDGYPYLSSPNTITYDNDNGIAGNGNMTSHLDKGISSIQYNFLNLPRQVTQNAQVTSYTYRADGVKVKKLFGNLETNYLDGFQYKSTFQGESWNGEGFFIPDPNEVPILKLRIIPTSEGYYDALLDKYVYNYTDHLGNIRLSYTDTNQDGIIQPRRYNASNCSGKFCFNDWKPGEIIEVNNYYPFGLLHNYLGPTQNAYQYKYNGKELQETGMYSLDWRQYMPDIGRFGVIDPLAGVIPSWTPYRYAFDNPIYFRDPNGLIEQGPNYVSDWIRNSLTGSYKFDPNVKGPADTPNGFEYVGPSGSYINNNGEVVNLLSNGEKETLIQEINVAGKKSESGTLDYLNFLNDRMGDSGDLIKHRPNQGGSIGFWTSSINNRRFDNITYNRLNVRYYSSNWTGGGRARVRTINVSKFLKKGSIVGQVILGAVEIGQSVADDIDDYNTKGETNGKNTAVAAGSVAGGVAGGWAGAEAGAAVGAAVGVWFGGVGAVPGAVIGGIIGGALGSWGGSEIGKAGVEKAYE